MSNTDTVSKSKNKSNTRSFRVKLDKDLHDILNTSVSVISVKIRGSRIEYQSTENDISWKSVKRIIV